MTRPASRQELIESAAREWLLLWEEIDSHDESYLYNIYRQASIGNQSRNPRDVLCHLHEWHELALQWVAVGSAGGDPEVPAPGYSWRTTPELNAELWERNSQVSFDDACIRVRLSHAKMMKTIESYSDEELFTKKYFPWTGSTSLGSYLTSATSSHYLWARKTLRLIYADYTSELRE